MGRFLRVSPAPALLLALLLTLLGLAALLSGCAGDGAGDETSDSASSPEFSNLVLVMIDTLRSDHLEAYGYDRKTAPFLAEVAREGIQLQAFSVSSWTRPSVATALTGLFPQRHQAITRGDRLSAAAPYLPSILSDSGFETFGYTANPTVGRDFDFERGFSRHEEYHGGKNAKPHATEVTDRALDLVASAKDRFFLYVHYLDPHDPYDPRQAWGQDGEFDSGDFIQPQDILRGRVPRSEEAYQQLRDQYDGAIREMDTEIRRLVEQLEAADRLRGTLFVVTSDHGELFGEHGGLTHGRGLWDEELRVPLIFWSAEGLGPHRPTGWFHHVDLMPTLLEALGMASPKELDGRSLWPDVVRGEVPARREYFYSVDLQPGAAALGLVRDEYKLIHRSIQPSTLLFDIEADAEELKNLASRGEVREDLLRRAVETHNRLSAGRFERTAGRIKDTTREQLAALGYIEEEERRAPDPTFLVRTLPSSMTFHGAEPFALFAGLAGSELSSSLDLRQTSHQLLRGWPRPWRDADEGAFCRREAGLALGHRDPKRRHLVLRGTVPTSVRSVRVEVSCDEGRAASSFSLKPGPVRLVVPECAPSRVPALVRVDLSQRPVAKSPAPANAPAFRGGGVSWRRAALVGGQAAEADLPNKR